MAEKINSTNRGEQSPNSVQKSDPYPHQLHGFKLLVPLVAKERCKKEIPTNCENLAVLRPLPRMSLKPAGTAVHKTDKCFGKFAKNKGYMTRVAPRIKKTTPF